MARPRRPKPPPITTPQCYSVSEAAAVWRVSEKTVRRAEYWPFVWQVRIGRRVLINHDDLWRPAGDPYAEPPTRKAFYTVAEVAGLLGCDEKTVRRFVWGGEMPARRAGRRVSVAHCDVIAFVLARRVWAGPGESEDYPENFSRTS